jgi:hypothetical protein
MTRHIEQAMSKRDWNPWIKELWKNADAELENKDGVQQDEVPAGVPSCATPVASSAAAPVSPVPAADDTISQDSNDKTVYVYGWCTENRKPFRRHANPKRREDTKELATKIMHTTASDDDCIRAKFADEHVAIIRDMTIGQHRQIRLNEWNARKGALWSGTHSDTGVEYKIVFKKIPHPMVCLVDRTERDGRTKDRQLVHLRASLFNEATSEECSDDVGMCQLELSARRGTRFLLNVLAKNLLDKVIGQDKFTEVSDALISGIPGEQGLHVEQKGAPKVTRGDLQVEKRKNIERGKLKRKPASKSSSESEVAAKKRIRKSTASEASVCNSPMTEDQLMFSSLDSLSGSQKAANGKDLFLAEPPPSIL